MPRLESRSRSRRKLSNRPCEWWVPEPLQHHDPPQHKGPFTAHPPCQAQGLRVAPELTHVSAHMALRECQEGPPAAPSGLTKILRCAGKNPPPPPLLPEGVCPPELRAEPPLSFYVDVPSPPTLALPAATMGFWICTDP